MLLHALPKSRAQLVKRARVTSLLRHVLETGAPIKRGFWTAAEDISVCKRQKGVRPAVLYKCLEALKIYIKLGCHQVSAGEGQQIEAF